MSAELRVGAVGAGRWAAANRLPILKTRRDAEAVADGRLGSEEPHEAQTQFAIPHRQGARQPRRLLRVRRRPAGYPLHHDITTSRLYLTKGQLASQPQAGGIFALKPGASGIPRAAFAA
jgi:hypothetical protein